MLLVLWFVGFLPLIPAQVNPSAGEGSASIAGTVVDAISGQVLGKAEVRLSGGAQPGAGRAGMIVTRTGANGAFALDGIPPGDYVLSVSRRSYAACGADVQGLGARQQGCVNRLSLRAGQKIPAAQIRLLPAAVVTGEVRDEDGEPMSGVVVEAEQYRYVRGAKVLSATARGTTDDRGTYRIFNLAPGRYFLKAQGRGLMARVAGAMMTGGGPGGMGAFGGGGRGGFLASMDDAVSYPATYYPNAEAAEEAIPLQLAAGAEMTGIDFRLFPAATFSVQGVISGLDNSQPVGMGVSARRLGSSGLVTGTAAVATADGRTGTFHLRGLPPGRYQLVARTAGGRRGGAQVGQSGVTMVDVSSAPVNDVSIVLQPDAVLQGKVVLPASSQTASSDNVSLERMSLMADQVVPGPQMTTRVSADGEFQMTLAAADRVSFSVNGVPDGFYVRSMTLGGVDLLAAGAAPPNDPSGAFLVTLATDGGTVSGVTRDAAGTAIGEARVVLMPEREGQARSLWRRTMLSGDEGSFQFADVAPGRYRLYVFEELDAGPALDPDFLSLFGQRWKAVEVKASGSVTAESSWIPSTETAMHLGEVAP